MIDVRTLSQRVLAGETMAISRAITLVESDSVHTADLLDILYRHAGQAFRIGITGPPGAGKSTLVDILTIRLREAGMTVGIICVDPTSPFSGGALLGDRIRMSEIALDEGVFIRSMASRGSLGGLAKATGEASLILDAAGKQIVILETVGVGQSELDVAREADTTVVVIVPESGDSIQAMKAGLMEIADILVVNKADREGAERITQELDTMLDLRSSIDGWHPPVVQTVATEAIGIQDLVEHIWRHRHHLSTGHLLDQHRCERIKAEIRTLAEEQLHRRLWHGIYCEEDLAQAASQVLRGETTPYRVVQEIMKLWKQEYNDLPS